MTNHTAGDAALPGAYVQSVQQEFPNAGFHQRLVQLALGWLPKHSLNLLPVFQG